MQVIGTAYAIELTKAMFARNTYGNSAELQKMLSLGARRDHKPTEATFTDTMAELQPVRASRPWWPCCRGSNAEAWPRRLQLWTNSAPSTLKPGLSQGVVQVRARPHVHRAAPVPR